MHRNERQRGFISLSGILSLVVLATLIVLAVRLLPPYISNYQFQDAINNVALVSTYSPASEEEIKKTIIAKAESCGIELAPQQVTVRKGGGSVMIVAEYSVTVDLFVRELELHFDPSTSNRNILAK
jgi:hypothetical protein